LRKQKGLEIMTECVSLKGIETANISSTGKGGAQEGRTKTIKGPDKPGEAILKRKKPQTCSECALGGKERGGGILLKAKGIRSRVKRPRRRKRAGGRNSGLTG